MRQFIFAPGESHITTHWEPGSSIMPFSGYSAAMDLRRCPHCATDVLPMAGDRCPQCGRNMLKAPTVNTHPAADGRVPPGCPNCGSGLFVVTTARRFLTLTNDRICLRCQTRYTPSIGPLLRAAGLVVAGIAALAGVLLVVDASGALSAGFVVAVLLVLGAVLRRTGRRS